MHKTFRRNFLQKRHRMRGKIFKVFIYNLIFFPSLTKAQQNLHLMDEGIFDTLRLQIEAHQKAHPGFTWTIPNALQALPDSFRNGFVALYKSRSLQPASENFPRILFYGEDAQNIVSFHGDPRKNGFDSLEFAEVDSVSGKIVFREMIFPANDSTEGKVQFSEKNPEKCAACHGSPSRYIWTPYASWQGAYGSRDDILQLTSGEMQNWMTFRAQQKSHPRYSKLVIDNEAQEPLAPFRYFKGDGTEKERRNYTMAIERRPNFRLGALLMRQQAKFAFRTAKMSPNYDRLKFDLAFELARCADGNFSAVGMPNAKALAILEKLGAPADKTWRLHLVPEDVNLHQDFNAGISTFQNAFQWHLWQDLGLETLELQKGAQAYSFEDVARKTQEYDFALGEPGWNLWKAMDRVAPIAGGLPGAFEANLLAKKAREMTEDKSTEACKILRSR
jgi:hypothetical protein